jgi:hypothetical protein
MHSATITAVNAECARSFAGKNNYVAARRGLVSGAPGYNANVSTVTRPAVAYFQLYMAR